jgi:hypothetical protein
MKIVALLFATIFVASASAQSATDNADLTKLFTTDQSARQGKNVDWSKLRIEDDQREVVLHKMLESGQVRTANDYFHAALIFQHGQHHEDFLLAHVLAVNAVSLGNPPAARWLSAATLDRYLLSISQPQIYGTQFEYTKGASGPVTLRTMDPSLLSDNVRALSCVISLAEQKKVLDVANSGGTFGGTGIPDCK